MFEAPWTYPHKINIDQQISELKRERGKRQGVYGREISRGALKQGAAEYQMGCIDACIATLEYMRDNRMVIIAAVAAAKAKDEVAA